MPTKKELEKDREIKKSIITALSSDFKNEIQKLREERKKVLRDAKY